MTCRSLTGSWSTLPPSHRHEADRLISHGCGPRIAGIHEKLVEIFRWNPAHTTKEKKWEASRLAMNGAHKWGEFLSCESQLRKPRVCWFTPLLSPPLKFSRASTRQNLRFVHGICDVYRDDEPTAQLREAALPFPVPIDETRRFDARHTATAPG